jgi:hypothetical protein
VSRRTQAIKRLRAAKKRQGAPILVALPRWCGTSVVVLHVGGRKPTERELYDFELATLRQWVAEAQAEQAQQQTESDHNPSPAS